MEGSGEGKAQARHREDPVLVHQKVMSRNDIRVSIPAVPAWHLEGPAELECCCKHHGWTRHSSDRGFKPLDVSPDRAGPCPWGS